MSPWVVLWVLPGCCLSMKKPLEPRTGWTRGERADGACAGRPLAGALRKYYEKDRLHPLDTTPRFPMCHATTAASHIVVHGIKGWT